MERLSTLADHFLFYTERNTLISELAFEREREREIVLALGEREPVTRSHSKVRRRSEEARRRDFFAASSFLRRRRTRREEHVATMIAARDRSTASEDRKRYRFFFFTAVSRLARRLIADDVPPPTRAASIRRRNERLAAFRGCFRRASGHVPHGNFLPRPSSFRLTDARNARVCVETRRNPCIRARVCVCVCMRVIYFNMRYHVSTRRATVYNKIGKITLEDCTFATSRFPLSWIADSTRCHASNRGEKNARDHL